MWGVHKQYRGGVVGGTQTAQRGGSGGYTNSTEGG